MCERPSADLTIIVPVYNDRDSILPLAREVEDAFRGCAFSYELLFVDDGSADDPGAVFEQNGLRSVRHEENRGYGAALKTGVLASDSEFVCFIDCDGTYPAEAILEMMPHARSHGMVVGARDPRQNPWQAYLGKRISTFLLGAAFGRKVADINSGLRIVRRSAFLEYLPALRDKFSITSSLTYAHLLDEAPVKYVPIVYRKRAGKTKVRRLPFVVEFLRCLASVRRFWMTRADGAPPKAERCGWAWTCAAFLVCLAVATAYDWQKLFQPYVIADDARQHVFWMSSLHDPALFAGSAIVEYAKYLTLPGFEALYWLGTWFCDPVLFGKLLAIVLFAFTGTVLFEIGRDFMGPLGGALTAFFFVGYPPLTLNFDGGLHRAFMFPLLALFLLSLLRRKHPLCIACLGLQFLFYPVAGVLSLCTYLLVLSLDGRVRRAFVFNRATAMALLFVIASLVAVSALKKANHPDFLGERYTGAEMIRDGAFDRGGGRHGYLPFRDVSNYVNRFFLREERYFDKSHDFEFAFAALPLFLLLSWIRGRRTSSLWLVLLALAASSVALFEAAKLFFFNLYIPDRYVMYSFGLLGTLLAGMSVSGAIGWIPSKAGRLVAAVFVAGIVVFVSWRSDVSFLPYGAIDETKNAPLYEYLRTLPKSAVIAAEPRLSDNIQTFSHRQAFVTYELALAWYKGYRALMDKRVLEFYDAYFSDDAAKTSAFMRRNGVSHLVVCKSRFRRGGLERMTFFYQPLEEELRARFRGRPAMSFALSRVEPRLRSYDDHRFFVVPAEVFSEK